jgi:hypothetical protein
VRPAERVGNPDGLLVRLLSIQAIVVVRARESDVRDRRTRDCWYQGPTPLVSAPGDKEPMRFTRLALCPSPAGRDKLVISGASPAGWPRRTLAGRVMYRLHARSPQDRDLG